MRLLQSRELAEKWLLAEVACVGCYGLKYIIALL
jgi:hypothetical protein